MFMSGIGLTFLSEGFTIFVRRSFQYGEFFTCPYNLGVKVNHFDLSYLLLLKLDSIKAPCLIKDVRV